MKVVGLLSYLSFEKNVNWNL